MLLKIFRPQENVIEYVIKSLSSIIQNCIKNNQFQAINSILF